MKKILPLIFISHSVFASTIIQFKPDVDDIPQGLKKEIKGQIYQIKPLRTEPRFFVQRLPETKWDIVKRQKNLAIKINDGLSLMDLQKNSQIEKIIEDSPISSDSAGAHINNLKSPQKDFPQFPCENTIYWGGEKGKFSQSLDDNRPCDGYWIEAMQDNPMTFEIGAGKHLEIFEDGRQVAQTDGRVDLKFSSSSSVKILVVSGINGNYDVAWNPQSEEPLKKKTSLADFSNAFGFGSLELSKAYELLTQQAPKNKLTPKHQGAKMMNVGMLWSEGYTGQNVRVAVIDTGVDFSHPFLKDVLENGYNIIEPEKKPSDDESHGTHVAGIIHQVAPEAKIVPIKVLDKDGSGSIEDVIAGVEWAIKEKVQIINLSLGGDIDQPKLRDVFQKAAENGIFLAMASGNDSAKEPTFPARYVTKFPGLGFAVGALNSDWELTNFSDRSGSNKNMKYVAAYGVNVNSSVPGGGYKKYSGTSMATPQVAGALAILKSIPETKDNKTMIKALSQSVYQTSIEYP